MLTLSDFAGNEPVKTALTGMLRTGRIPHALILEGAAGLGKKTLAGFIAAASLCTGGDGKSIPCGQCGGCRLSAGGVHPDLIWIRPAGQTLSVDTVRQVRQDVYTLPHQAPRRVFIFPEADAMTEQAQNALLKVLEEPPAYVVFLLLTVSASRLLATIRSRGVVLTLSAPGPEEAAERVTALMEAGGETDGLSLSREKILSVLAAEGGNIGRALDLLRAGEEPAEERTAAAILREAAEGSDLSLLQAAHALEKDRKNARRILESLLAKIQAALLYKAAGGGPGNYPGQRLSRNSLAKMEDITRTALRGLDRNANLPLLSSYLCACFKEAAGL
ncbi:MAG: DNA polymerase III subunit [Clostridiales bacterium]|nr:DNA polymerase III subunit [Clostridiales bacterium]